MQPNINTTGEKVRKQTKKMPQRKARGLDGVHGYWMKEITTLHSRIAEDLDECLHKGQAA